MREKELVNLFRNIDNKNNEAGNINNAAVNLRTEKE